MQTKPAFNSPADLSAPEVREVPVNPEVRTIVNPGSLIGSWVNVDPATRGITKIVVGWGGGGHLSVHAYGACSPTPCDWGGVAGIAYGPDVANRVADAFTAVYSVAFKDTIVAGVMQGNLLSVNSFSHFKDSSGRSDYHSRDLFRK